MIKLFVSDQNLGLLYSLLEHEKVKLITKYHYTTVPSAVYADNRTIYVLGELGMLACSIRPAETDYFHFHSPQWITHHPAAGLQQIRTFLNDILLLSKTTEDELMRRLSAQLSMTPTRSPMAASRPMTASRQRNATSSSDGSVLSGVWISI